MCCPALPEKAKQEWMRKDESTDGLIPFIRVALSLLAIGMAVIHFGDWEGEGSDMVFGLGLLFLWVAAITD